MSTTNTETPTIRSKYSDDQLRDALITATELRERIFIRGTVGADGAYGSQHWSEDQINDLHAILNVLQALNHDNTGEDPGEQSRVWEETKDIQEVRRGDEIRIETKGFVGYYSSPVAKVDISNGWLHFQNGDYYAWDDRDHVSRIPAPVVNPDPEEHRLIIVHEFDGKPAPEGSYASICQNMHGNPIYEYVPGDGSQTMTTSGAGITRWEPATIVPKAESDG